MRQNSLQDIEFGIHSQFHKFLVYKTLKTLSKSSAQGNYKVQYDHITTH